MITKGLFSKFTENVNLLYHPGRRPADKENITQENFEHFEISSVTYENINYGIFMDENKKMRFYKTFDLLSFTCPDTTPCS